MKKRKTFKEAVEATLDVRNCYHVSLQALEKYDRKKVKLTEIRNCGGSLFIDQCLINQNKNANDARWDYAIDYNGKVYFIEVHTASTREVSSVLNKLNWLKEWLLHRAPEINAMKADKAFYWIQSNGNHIAPNSSQERLIKQNNLKPIPKLILK